MSNFVLNSHHLRKVLLHYFISKKTAAERHRILVKVYGEHDISETTCRDWFWRFKSVDFDLSNKDHGKLPKKFEHAELQALLPLLDEDSTQTLKQLAEALGVDQGSISGRLHAIGKIQTEGKWVPYELKERDIERRKNTCEILFNRFERVIFASHCYWRWKVDLFDNLKRKKSWVDPGQPSTSRPVRNIHGRRLCCVRYLTILLR